MSAVCSAPLKVAWINDFPVEWLPDLPETLRHLPRSHPRTWQQVLLQQLEGAPDLDLHILILRKSIRSNITFQRNGITFHIIKIPRGVREPSFYWIDTLLLKRELAKIQPHLVHAWGTERGEEVIARRLGYPYLVTIQGLLMWYSELVPLNRYERLAAFLETQSLPKAPLVTTESKFAVNYLHARFPDLRVFQAEHAPNPNFFLVKRSPQSMPLRFLFVGFLDYRKGADILFSALDSIRHEFEFELVLAGTISERFSALVETLKSQPTWKGLQVRGSLSASQIVEELSKATMLLFPTRADTSPNAVKEAVVAGVPVVASAVGGITDYVLSGKNGFTFPSDNLPEFVSRLREACRHPLFSKGLVETETLTTMREYLAPLRMKKRFLQAYEILAKRQPLEKSSALMFP